MTATSPAGLAAPQPLAARIRVLLVDDSGVSRAIMTRWIEESGVAAVVAVAPNGRAALDELRAKQIDVVVLDVEMPELDGLSALPQLLAIQPGVQVLMASTLTVSNARTTLEALRLGAADTIAKPRAGWSAAGGPDFRTELVMKIKALGEAAQQVRDRRLPPPPPRAVPSCTGVCAGPQEPVRRAARSHRRPQALVVGASTGGPNALFRFFELLPRELAVPVLITQHMPPTFTAILAEHLGRHSGFPVCEAKHGQQVAPGHVYVAPGGHHLAVGGTAHRPSIIVDDSPPENFCRPSVNPLMRSAARIFGAATLGVMLTGMGTDGLEGARAIVEAGGTIFAQDQATSVVWGMPGAVVRGGLAAEVLPLDDLAMAVGRLIGATR